MARFIARAAVLGIAAVITFFGREPSAPPVAALATIIFAALVAWLTPPAPPWLEDRRRLALAMIAAGTLALCWVLPRLTHSLQLALGTLAH